MKPGSGKAKRPARPVGRSAAHRRARAPSLGVFDSGIGGLTVVRHLRRLLPDRRIVYFGDSARVPYGTKSAVTVRRFAGEAVRFLAQFGVGEVIVACNTVSAVALRSLDREFPGLAIEGVIEPGAEAAVRSSRAGRIGVIGTRATVESRAYEVAIAGAARRAGRRVRVVTQACPLLVPLAEEGMTATKAARAIVAEYVEPLRRRRIDTLILGCTHYPPFRSTLRRVLGPRVTLIDSGEATAQRLAHALSPRDGAGRRAAKHAPRGTRGGLTCYVSDIPRQFEAIGRRFLGHRLGRVHLVAQDDLPWFERPPRRSR